LDLPQPFGPTMPVIPGSIKNSDGSTKVLKPVMRSLLNFIGYAQALTKRAKSEATVFRIIILLQDLVLSPTC
jgi:hypothetical protein